MSRSVRRRSLASDRARSSVDRRTACGVENRGAACGGSNRDGTIPRFPRIGTKQVFLDDERDTPAGWHRVYWPDEAIALLRTGEVVELSLDHDLGDDERGTGYDVIVWIERAVIERGFAPPAIRVHSANPAARLRMLAGIEAISRARAAMAPPAVRGDG